MTSADTTRPHALVVSIDRRSEDMETLLRIEKIRLINQHRSEIEEWTAHASELGNELRRRHNTTDRLWMSIAAVACIAVYLLVRDVGCSPWWSK